MSDDPEQPTSAPAPRDKREPDDGVDMSLVRWCLSLTPQERLDVLQANVNAILRLRDAARTGGKRNLSDSSHVGRITQVP